MAGIYRKKAIDRLSSPEQLDKMVPITQPSTWLILLGLFIIITASAIWAFCGEITETYSMQGITIMSDTKFQAVSEKSIMLICYIPQSDGERLAVGMQIAAQTDNNKKIKGHIVQVGSYITPSEEVLSLLRDEILTSYFTSGGPILAVRCEIDEESITLGALTQAEVIVSSNHPITYVLKREF